MITKRRQFLKSIRWDRKYSTDVFVSTSEIKAGKEQFDHEGIKTAVALFFLNVWSPLRTDRTGLTPPQLLVLHRSLTGGRTAAETSFYRPTDRASEGGSDCSKCCCSARPAVPSSSHRGPLALLGPCLPPIRSRQLTSELCAAGVRRPRVSDRS